MTFHAHHVGSLLRPPPLREAFRQSRDPGELRAAQDNAIREVVATQEALGLKLVTDGEFRRGSYWAHFVDAVDGLEVRDALFEFTDASGDRMAFTAPHVAGPIKRAGPISAGEFEFLRSAATVTPKLTMPSPSTMHFWRGPDGFDADVYPSVEAVFDDLASVYRDEIADLAGRGATYLQMDEVALAMLCDPDVRDAVSARGEQPDALVGAYVDAINKAISDRPAGVTMAMHVCRGNYKGHWMAAGGYEPVAERVFGTTEVDELLLEFDSPRAGDFAPLRHVPAGTRVVLGLLSSKSPELESRDELLTRIDAATKYVPIDRLGLSPQCGFASTAAGNPLTEEDQKRKLALVVDVADAVWGSA